MNAYWVTTKTSDYIPLSITEAVIAPTLVKAAILFEEAKPHLCISSVTLFCDDIRIYEAPKVPKMTKSKKK